MSKPYKEEIKNGIKYREFDHMVETDELVWHRDKRDRKVTVLEGEGWFFQMDNDIPRPMKEGEEFFVPKEEYHRIYKQGTTPLKISIKETYMQTFKEFNEGGNTISWGEKTKLFNRFLEIYRDTVENRDNPQITDAQMSEAKDIVKKLGRKYQERVRPTLVFRVGPRYDEMVDLYRKKNTKNIKLNKQAPTVQDLANQIAALTRGKVSKRSSPVMTTGLGSRQRDASQIVLYNNKQGLEKAKGWLEKNGKPISFKNLGTVIQGYKIGKYLIVPNFTAKKGSVEHYLEITTFSKTSTGGRSLKLQ